VSKVDCRDRAFLASTSLFWLRVSWAALLFLVDNPSLLLLNGRLGLLWGRPYADAVGKQLEAWFSCVIPTPDTRTNSLKDLQRLLCKLLPLFLPWDSGVHDEYIGLSSVKSPTRRNVRFRFLCFVSKIELTFGTSGTEQYYLISRIPTSNHHTLR